MQKNIKNRLEKKNISIAELERRIGLRHAVINILHGRSKNPSIRVAQAIAKELGCSMEDLLAEENKLYTNIDNNTHLLPTTKTTPNHANNQPTTVVTGNLQQPWDPSLAKKAIEAISKYLIKHELNPPTTEIFQCIDEIYRYSYNNPQQQVDLAFVNWIAEKLFIRKVK